MRRTYLALSCENRIALNQVIPITDGVSPDKYFKFVRCYLLCWITHIQPLRLHPSPHTFATGIIDAASACAVHTLPDSISVDSSPVNPAGDCAPVRITAPLRTGYKPYRHPTAFVCIIAPSDSCPLPDPITLK